MSWKRWLVCCCGPRTGPGSACSSSAAVEATPPSTPRQRFVRAHRAGWHVQERRATHECVQHAREHACVALRRARMRELLVRMVEQDPDGSRESRHSLPPHALDLHRIDSAFLQHLLDEWLDCDRDSLSFMHLDARVFLATYSAYTLKRDQVFDVSEIAQHWGNALIGLADADAVSAAAHASTTSSLATIDALLFSHLLPRFRSVRDDAPEFPLFPLDADQMAASEAAAALVARDPPATAQPTFQRPLSFPALIDKYVRPRIRSPSESSLVLRYTVESLDPTALAAIPPYATDVLLRLDSADSARSGHHIPPHAIADHVTTLRLFCPHDMALTLEPGALPSALHTLYLPDGFNAPLTLLTLPPSLRTLAFTGASTTISSGSGGNFNQPLSADVLPHQLERLHLSAYFVGPLAAPSVMTTTTTTTATTTTGAASSPSRLFELKHLRHIEFGFAFNQLLEPGCLPPSLTHLSFGSNYNRPIRHGVLPAQLTSLEFSTEFDQTLGLGILPRALRFLRFKNGSKFNQKLDLFDLPPALEELVFDGYSTFDTAIGLNCLPESLRTLKFGSAFNRRLRVGVFPAGLRDLTFGYCFNQPIPVGVLPSTLERLEFNDSFNKPLAVGALPSSLRVLTFGNAFNQRLRIGVLPEGLRELTVGFRLELCDGEKHDRNRSTLVVVDDGRAEMGGVDVRSARQGGREEGKEEEKEQPDGLDGETEANQLEVSGSQDGQHQAQQLQQQQEQDVCSCGHVFPSSLRRFRAITSMLFSFREPVATRKLSPAFVRNCLPPLCVVEELA